jgi:hypothetical protein
VVITWQLIQARGSSDRYEKALEILRINKKSPVITAEAMITGPLQFFGGRIELMIFFIKEQMKQENRFLDRLN